MMKERTINWHQNVALRKESVDRNTENAVLFLMTAGRSPQGERG